MHDGVHTVKMDNSYSSYSFLISRILNTIKSEKASIQCSHRGQLSLISSILYSKNLEAALVFARKDN